MRTGICSDYAIFTATALLAGGANYVYILNIVFNKPHATVAIEINSGFLVLDMVLPLYEFNDYIEKRDELGSPYMKLYRVWLENNEFVAERFEINIRDFISKKPKPYLYTMSSKKLLEDAIIVVLDVLQIQSSPSCKSARTFFYSPYTVDYYEA